MYLYKKYSTLLVAGHAGGLPVHGDSTLGLGRAQWRLLWAFKIPRNCLYSNMLAFASASRAGFKKHTISQFQLFVPMLNLHHTALHALCVVAAFQAPLETVTESACTVGVHVSSLLMCHRANTQYRERWNRFRFGNTVFVRRSQLLWDQKPNRIRGGDCL